MTKKITNQEALESALKEENYSLATLIQQRIDNGEVYIPEYQLLSISRIFLEKMSTVHNKELIINKLIEIATLSTHEEKYRELEKLFHSMS